MPYERHQMVYQNYKWTASSDKDNPYYRGGLDHAELNRTEGYEMLYFINHFVDKNKAETLLNYQRTERMIKDAVPPSIRKRQDIANWILLHW